MTLLRGRDFTFADNMRSRKVAVISETVERRLFGQGQGVGRRMRISLKPEWQDVEIVGVVSDARVFDVRHDDLAIAYTAAIQSGPDALYRCLVARAPASTAPELKKAIESLGVDLMPRSQTLAYARGRAILQERLMAALGSAFAVLALVLVAAGIYGLLSYVFSMRRKEIGIRMALGADARQMARRIVSDGLIVAAIGTAIGLIGAVASVPLLRSVLVEVSPYDPLAIGAACVVLIVVTLGASIAPALRASRVEPIAELRQD
jgi:ABC-type antimicrobial peptide transport system permease subunit